MNIIKVGGRYVVPAESVAAELGYSIEALPECAGWAGMRLNLLDDGQGNPALDVEQADKLVAGAKAHMEAHYAKWEAYRAYLAERKREAQAERQRRFEEDRRAAQEEARRRGEAWNKERARKADQDIAERLAAQAARAGNPLPPEKFFKTLASA
jgi:hypothetical protein